MPRITLKAIATASLIALPGGGATAQTADAGAYLAARHAGIHNDFADAAHYYVQALVGDAGNPILMESLIAAQISLGQTQRALPVARLLAQAQPDNQIANMALLAETLNDDDYAAVIAAIDEGRGINPLVNGLIGAWAEVGLGRMSEALDRFDAVAEAPGLQHLANYHKALALGLVGDFEGAVAIFAATGDAALPPTRRGMMAYAEALSQLERNDDAIVAFDSVFGPQPDPGLAALRADLVDGGIIARASVRNVRDGMAEVFYSAASVLEGETGDAYALLYARIAEMLRPDMVDAHLLSASLLERLGQDELAIAAFRAVPGEDPGFYAAEQGRAEALRRAGRDEAALEVLEQLARSHDDIAVVHVSLGDLLRMQEQFDRAVDSYTRALTLYDDTTPDHWVIYFARGIAHERLKNWDAAEADFFTALELNPDQPQVLNYLGYSWLEMQVNLEDALAMIETAVQLRPDDGYITDSLGWGYYKLGRYDEAVVHMERAVELMSEDPILSDHLGDVYWAVGREREARFQWRRALSFEPEEADAERIRRKLDVGLDVVLAEEGAPPLVKIVNER